MAILLGKEVVSTIHPKYWPYSIAPTADFNFLNGPSAYGANSGTFWNYVANSLYGAVNTTASKTADTYYTYVDISGSHGAMGTITLPMNATTASGFYTIKLTTDGVVEEFKTPTRTLSNAMRHWLGFAKEYASINDVRYQNEGGYGLYRFNNGNGIDKYFTGTIRSAQDMVVQGLPVHLFETSLKVEVKCSITGNGNGYECNGGVIVYSHPN